MTAIAQGRSRAASGQGTSPLVTVARNAALFDPEQLAASPAAPPATPAHPEEIVAHLVGAVSLHLFLLDAHGRTRYGVLEHGRFGMPVDAMGPVTQPPEDGVARLQAVRAELARRGVEAALEEGPCGGARLWVFAEQPLPAARMRALLEPLVLDRSVALYPRSDMREAGECVSAPLGVSAADGRRHGFLDPRGEVVAGTLDGQLGYLERVRTVEMNRQPDPEGRDATRGGEMTTTQPVAAEKVTAVVDRTVRAVRAQLAGMGAERYEIGVRDGASGRMLLRTWEVAQMDVALPWLKARNRAGSDIYVRPAGSIGLVLVDDLPAAVVQQLRRDGLAPAVVTETSPGNHQAWVRLSWQPLEPALATAAARELAERYGGDRNSADWRHLGRMAGFTNQKPVHTRPDGRQPYVRLHDAGGALAAEAERLVERARERLAATPQRPSLLLPGLRPEAWLGRRFPQEPGDQSPWDEVLPRTGGGVSALGREYQQRAQRLLERYPASDLSRVDWMVAKGLALAHPGLDALALAQAMREGSPQLEERKRGHVQDYIARTTSRALQDPEVAQAWGQARSREHDRGR
jgi:hypothetical protein